MLPYRSLGSGIPQAMTAWPDIDLLDDRRGHQFRVVIRRPIAGMRWLTDKISSAWNLSPRE